MERFYRRFFEALPIREVACDDDLHLLNPDELRLIGQTERWALCAAVLIELAAYLTIFLPIYAFPEFFEASALTLGGPFLHASGRFHWLQDAWMLAVTLAELYALLLMNLAAVHGVAVATGFIRRDRAAAETSGLVRIALENRFMELRELGIDPYERMNPWTLYLYLAFNRLKGLLGSVLLRAALTNLFGREILRVYLDFSGMPIYMLVNVLTTHAILRNARVVIMGETSIESILRQLPDISLTPWEADLIYDSLQFIAVNKRDYHANHYYLTKAVLSRFAIRIKTAHPLSADYLDKLQRAEAPAADVCKLIVVLGFLLDGVISRRERKQLALLRQRGILDLENADIERFCRAFSNGQGLDEMTRRLSIFRPPQAV